MRWRLRRHVCNTRRRGDRVSDRSLDFSLISTNASPASKGPLPDEYFRHSRFNGGMRRRSKGKSFRDVRGGSKESKGNEGAKGVYEQGYRRICLASGCGW